MEQELLSLLLHAAIALSGMPALELRELPPVLRMSHDELTAQICPRDPESCQGMVAIFDIDRQRIVLDEKLDMELVDDNSFLVHELVHVLQFRQWGHWMYENCEESTKTEAQAYQVQNAYLRKEGRLLRVHQRVPFASCDGASPSF